MPAGDLPRAVRSEITTDSLLDYWRARVAQHTSDSYAGVALSKFPEDLRTYEHLLWLQRADTVIEIGTQAGGSALWFRDRLRTLASYHRITQEPRVISVDLDQARAREELHRADPEYASQIVLVEGDVRDSATIETARAAIGTSERSCFIVEDSAHTYSTTRASLEAFADLVRIGGFFVVEDGCVDLEPLRIDDDWPRGVLPAVRDWLASEQGRGFTCRRELELYGVSCHPQGFLQHRTA
jgi:cephalosporin hydroxylase